jgi:hypothetical protein
MVRLRFGHQDTPPPDRVSRSRCHQHFNLVYSSNYKLLIDGAEAALALADPAVILLMIYRVYEA